MPPRDGPAAATFPWDGSPAERRRFFRIAREVMILLRPVLAAGTDPAAAALLAQADQLLMTFQDHPEWTEDPV